MVNQDIAKEKEYFEKYSKYKIDSSDELDEESIKLYLKDLLRHLKKEKGLKILEIASGGGHWGVNLLKQIECDYIGVDLSPALVENAKKRAAKEGIKAKYIEGDATNLPFKEDTFDFVFVTYSLHHFPSQESLDKVTSEVYRVLKKGGIYYTLEPNGLNPLIFFWWLRVSPERILPLGKQWRETEDLTVNESIIYPITVKRSLKTKFDKVKSYTFGFIPNIGPFKNKKGLKDRLNSIVGKIPLLNSFGGSFVVLGEK